MGKPFQKLLTFQERILIEKHVKDGMSGREIAEVLNRSKNCIHTELRKNGGENYSAKQAQDRCDKIKLEKQEKLRQFNLNTGKKSVSSDRLSIVEMHIDIILDEIMKLKELINDKR